MNPAPSVIVFTVGSGAGYGLLAALGLLASTFHLGHPERAWRALSQWRSSWLSREAVVAAATYPPALLLGALAAFGGSPGAIAALGILTAVLAAGTIACTAMIYRSLKPIHAWHNRLTVPGYLIIGAATGLSLAYALLSAFGSPAAWWAGAAAVAALAAGFLHKRAYWAFLDTTSGPSTPESATGLGPIGRVRLLDAPHTGKNFVMREMGFAVARKHAALLRRVALAVGFVGPAWAIALGLGVGGAAAAGLGAAAAVSALAGALVERWLFFAEARHAAMLYYGAASA
jgi:DMSO reductase anchor subunit